MKNQKSCHYALRENPKKKTQKSFGLESPESMKKILFRCGKCGKGFRYEKCLSNHQKVTHLSTKQKEVYEEPMTSLCRSFNFIKKKKRSRVMRYKKTPLSCSFTTFLETRSVSAENDEDELEVAESLILLSMSCPKFVELVASPVIPNGSYDSGSKKMRKGGEFESGFFSNEQTRMEERVSSYETWKEPVSFMGDKQKGGKTSECELGFLSNEHKLLKEAISSDETSSFLGYKSVLDQEKLRKGGEFGSGFSSNEQKLGDFDSDSELEVVGDMERSDSDTENVTESNKEDFEYQCKLCKKIFSSYQALGGHQTVHRMSKSKSKKHYCRFDSVGEPEGDESVTVTVKKGKKKSVYALKKSHGKSQHSKTEDLEFLSDVPVGIEF